MTNSPLSDAPIVIPKGEPVDENGYTRQDYEAMRRSRVKHAISLLNQNGVKPFFIVSVEEVMALDERLDGRRAAAALDLCAREYVRPGYAELFAPYIKKALEHNPDENSQPT
jgi:hypothetical protein